MLPPCAPYREPGCQTCKGICQERHECLDMNSRRDVVYFGIDEYEDPLLTYYKVGSATH